MRFPLFSLIALLLLASCTQDVGETPFVITQVKAQNLIKKGMEKMILGDTVVPSPEDLNVLPVLSPDSSKRAWIEGVTLIVSEANSPDQRIVLYDKADAGSAIYCFGPAWSSDGSEISFEELDAEQTVGDSVLRHTRVIIALGEGQLE